MGGPVGWCPRVVVELMHRAATEGRVLRRRSRRGRLGLPDGRREPTASLLRTMAHEFIYQAYKLARHYPPDKTVLENISLSFYPGAKIGVHRARTEPASRACCGSWPGWTTATTGEARLTPGFTVGYLAQEPQLDPTKDVKGNVHGRPVATVQALIDRVQRGHGPVGRPRRRLRQDRQAEQAEPSRTRSRPPMPGTWNATSTSRWTRCAARPTMPTSRRCPAARSGGSRCARLLLSTARPAAARRADEPPRRRVGRSGSSASCQDYTGTVVAITHDRYFLDNVAEWILELDRGRGIPFEGNYSSWLEQKLERLEQRGEVQNEARQRTLERELEWVRMAPKARQAKGKARLAAYEKLHCRRPTQATDIVTRKLEIAIPPGPRLGDTVIEVERSPQGLRRPAAHRGPLVLAAAGRHRRHHRAERRRQDDAVPDADARRRPGEVAAGRRLDHDRRHRATLELRRPGRATTSTATRRSTRRSPRASSTSRSAPARSTARAYVSSFNFKGTDQQKPRRQAVRRRTQPRPPRQAAQVGRQRAAARRAHERPRRRHAAGARDRDWSRSPAVPS